MPLVSISDRRLGGTENSSLRYFSAMRALDNSTSRMVRPSFSRRVRRLFPAGSICTPPKLLDIISNKQGLLSTSCTSDWAKNGKNICYESRTTIKRPVYIYLHVFVSAVG